MTTITVADYTSSQIDRDAAIKKVWRRLIPFLFVLYIFNYLDRINIGFAALSMNKDLLLTATTFGLANSIFYIGYVACEIPSNLLMVRYGARIWIARILVSWGLASAATMLVVGPNSLYVVRFLVGVLEAGFVPGVLLYLTYWIPNSHRARANGYLMMAQPVAMALGAGVSGLILDHLNGVLGLQGWRWLFLLEGLPAAILGLVAYAYLTDKPKDATWLEQAEQNTLTSLLADDQSSPGTKTSVWKQIAEPKILLLALAYFCLVNTINANATWIPTIVREVLKAYSLSQVGFVTAIPAISALILMPLWTRSSDRMQERVWHVVAALGMAAAGWLLVIFFPAPELRLVGLIFTVSGAFCAMCTFWTLPQSLLSEAARPAGIGLISAVGLLGSAVSPAVIGFLRDATGNFNAGLFYVTALLAVSIVLVLIVPRLRAVAA
ncbi:MFS transporter [Bradyrhizobium canariense]|uniref:MFS transporter, ACS family, 4-hydroxyphenylacetate permease n=1 Tax=Bradyrhizobium canariense TaxID=255045 RepID=A0A1H2BP43_9BRAD|nr:MFS transporter [Bradyrhizobium canariense]SDT59817.1 MFS transporter, ACS family, 4-hydroxyphenylacetate permease [Bradyrhizobium canariense]